MRKMVFILLMFLVGSGLFSEKIGTLPDLLKPESITAYNDELYIVEGATIFVYSSTDLKLLRKFGKEGQGPGELPVAPNYSNKVTVYPDHVIAECQNKLVYYTKEGKLKKEIKKTSFMIIQAVPVGKNFVVNKLLPGEDRKTMYHAVSLYDAEMKEIKELYRMKFMQQGQPPSATMDMLFDYPMFRVYDNKIFIEESADGFIIDVFDQDGNKLYRIEKDYKKNRLSQKHKDEIFDRLTGDTLIRAMGGLDEFKRIFKLDFPDTFPAIQGIEVSNKKIYVQTYNERDSKEEFIIMDLKGKVIKRVFLPKFRNTTLVGSILGTKLHTIHDDKLYYLSEDEETEEWELHKEEIR